MIAARIISNNPQEFCLEESSRLLGTAGRGPFMAPQRDAIALPENIWWRAAEMV